MRIQPTRASMGPEIVQHPLARADGSTIFSDGLYTILVGVNGPVEVQRRDELPEEAAVEVNLRPSFGVGGPRERWLETVIQSVLENVLLVHLHPRTLFQITFQVTRQPEAKLRKTAGDVSILPTLLNAAFIALVDGGLPLGTTMSAALAIVGADGEVIHRPNEKDIAGCKSIHAMAYDMEGEQLLDQSSGSFDMEVWEKVEAVTKRACAAAIASAGEDAAMTNGNAEEDRWLMQTVSAQATTVTSWRQKT